MENKSKRKELETVDRKCSERKVRKDKEIDNVMMANLTPDDRDTKRRTRRDKEIDNGNDGYPHP